MTQITWTQKPQLSYFRKLMPNVFFQTYINLGTPCKDNLNSDEKISKKTENKAARKGSKKNNADDSDFSIDQEEDIEDSSSYSQVKYHNLI